MGSSFSTGFAAFAFPVSPSIFLQRLPFPQNVFYMSESDDVSSCNQGEDGPKPKIVVSIFFSITPIILI